MKKQRKGFTIVELVIVIVIVGILTITAVPIYQYHVEKAYLTEALTMLRAIADANTMHYMEHHTWTDDIRQLNVSIDGTESLVDGLYRIETKNFVYACCGDSATSNTIATVNRKPFKERYWFSFSAVPNKKTPKMGKYEITGDATYNKSKQIDKMLVKYYKDKYK
jgi:prepilin-type N-terminal cleavage/methylation domain-containing protein